MKKLFKTIVVALFVSALSVSAMATTNLEPELEKTFQVGMYYDYNQGLIKTFFEKEKGDQLKVTFLDNNGDELSKAYVTKKSVVASLSFDVNTLPSGTYSLEVSNGEEVIRRSVEISNPKSTKIVKFSK
jgi:spermidine/putrescine-binding protein